MTTADYRTEDPVHCRLWRRVHPHTTNRPKSSPATPFGWRRAIVLVLATLFLLNLTLVLGRHTGRWDAQDYFCPYFMLIADHARAGELLLWTPLVNGGAPVGFEPQIGAMSPIVLGLGLITGGHEAGFRVYWLAIWALGGLGVLAMARHLAIPAWMACIAAVSFMFCAVYMGHAQHTSYLVAMSWLPWLVWRLDVAVQQRRLIPAAQAGALWGLSALGGYPGMIVASGGYAGLWVAARSLSSPNRWQGAKGLIQKTAFLSLVLGLFTLVGLLVMAPTYAGFLVESQGYSDRAGALPREYVLNSDALHPAALGTFASPYLSLRVAASTDPLWKSDLCCATVYLSPVLLVLACNLTARSPQARFRWMLVVIAGLFLATAMGGSLPLRGWLYDLAPPTRYFRMSALFRCHALFTLVVLAMLAGRDLIENAADGECAPAWRRFQRASWLLACLALTSFAILALLSPGSDGPWNLLLGAVHLGVVWLGLAWLAWRGARGDTAVRQRVLQRSLVALVLVDAAFTLILSKPTVYSNRKGWSDVESQRVASTDLSSQGFARQLRPTEGKGVSLNAHLPMKVAVLDSYTPMASRLHWRFVAHPTLAASAIGTERTWFCRAAKELPLCEDSFDQLAKAVDRLGRPCLVISRAPTEAMSTTITGSQDRPRYLSPEFVPVERIAAKVVEYKPNTLTLNVSTPERGWVLVTERWAPGWQVLVNGRPQPLWIGNLLFRAVEVEPGDNQIEFRYRPFGHPWLLAMSWSVLGLVLVVPALTIIRFPRHKSDSPCSP